MPCSFSENHLNLGKLNGTRNLKPSELKVWQRFLIVNADELQILHHYVNGLYHGISLRPAHEKIWRDIVPQDAIHHKPLLHGIIAITAIQLSYRVLNTRKKYWITAMHHHALALSSLRIGLNSVTAENSDALFSLSNLVTGFSFALGQNIAPDSKPIEEMLGIAELLRGAQAITKMCRPWLQQGKLRSLFQFDILSMPENTSRELDDALERLRQSIHLAQVDQEEKTIYEFAIDSLMKHLQVRPSCFDNPVLALMWLVDIDRKFLDLVKGYHPLALVIMGHFGAVLCEVQGRWWALPSGFRLISAIYAALDQEWHQFIMWPRQPISPVFQESQLESPP